MKLNCDVVVIKRDWTGGSKPKPSKATLTIFRESKTKPIQLRISCTSKPKIDAILANGNVQGVFSKMAEKGMTTIRFGEPSVDVMVSKADPVQLSAFLKILRSASSGEDISLPNSISSSHQASSSQPKPAPTKLEITQRQDYPFWTPLPSTLMILNVENCRLTEFDNRILKLRPLVSLTLTGNDFGNGRLDGLCLSSLQRLVCLALPRNGIDQISDYFCNHLPASLKTLFLAGNNLTSLPDALFDNPHISLTILDVSGNRLESLSKKISAWKSSLSTLNMSRNQLTVVPASISSLRLQHTDFSGNLFVPVQRTIVEDLEDVSMGIPTLVEMAGAVCAQNRLPPSWLPQALQAFVRQVATLQCDICGRFSYPSRAKSQQYSMDLRSISASISRMTNSGSLVTLEGICCSNKCSKIFLSGTFCK